MSSFAHILLQWFAVNGRDLPWRRTCDPYAVWLSEVILQQTRVEQGRDYWERFMRRWPTVDALAAATEDEVLRLWQGLGYYSRARNLHHAARQIVALGHFPDTVEGLRQLKGVGDYTAAAIASIAFGRPVAVVDGNVYRVLSRYFGIDTPINTTEGKHLFAELAQRMMDDNDNDNGNDNENGNDNDNGRASLYNQAIMDFGAIQCTPQSPRCGDCPLSSSCEALLSGRVGELPVKLKTLKIRERRLIYVYIRCHGYTAIHRRGPGDIWQGLWEPYLVELPPSSPASEPSSVSSLPSFPLVSSPSSSPDWLCGLRLCRKHSLVPLQTAVRHVLTHRVLLADFWLLEVDERPPLPDGYIWIPEDALDDYALPRLVERLREALR